jgi:hypothetical protein
MSVRGGILEIRKQRERGIHHNFRERGERTTNRSPATVKRADLSQKIESENRGHDGCDTRFDKTTATPAVVRAQSAAGVVSTVWTTKYAGQRFAQDALELGLDRRVDVVVLRCRLDRNATTVDCMRGRCKCAQQNPQ